LNGVKETVSWRIKTVAYCNNLIMLHASNPNLYGGCCCFVLGADQNLLVAFTIRDEGAGAGGSKRNDNSSNTQLEQRQQQGLSRPSAVGNLALDAYHAHNLHR
jgi:hypothetical protein